MREDQSNATDPTLIDWFSGIASLVIFVLVIAFSSLFLFTNYWYLWPILILVGVTIITLRQIQHYDCRCQACGHEFSISFFKSLLAPHGVNKKGSWQWVTCPSCHERTKAITIKKVKE